MPGIHVGSTESIDSALKRFKKQVEKGGILSEVRRREYYEKPSQTKKKKKYVYNFKLYNYQFDGFEESELYPIPGLEKVGDAKTLKE